MESNVSRAAVYIRSERSSCSLARDCKSFLILNRPRISLASSQYISSWRLIKNKYMNHSHEILFGVSKNVKGGRKIKVIELGYLPTFAKVIKEV